MVQTSQKVDKETSELETESDRFVSVIIPSKRGELLQSCLRSLEKQIYPANMFEIIVVSREERNVGNSSSMVVRTIINEKANQAEARNIAEKRARGDVLAFCDDDCILPSEWIKNGVKHFAETNVSTVGGPSIPPISGVSFREVITGLLMMSFLGTGSHRKAYTSDFETEPRLCRTVDIICANMFVDRPKFNEINGFDGTVPQEEDRLNTKFLKKGYKLIYDPACYNVHHQRPFGTRAIRNMFWLMAGQGSLTKERHRPSSNGYVIPPLFAAGLTIGPVLFWFNPLGYVYIGSVLVYIISVLAQTLHSLHRNANEFSSLQKIKVLITLPFAFFIHHVTSGFGFLYGFFRSLLSRRRRN
jgi:glycosyltransferase involved in cell wall biosynthesis